MSSASLYIFSGLPACGKSTLSKRLAEETGAAYFRIDTVEQALFELCDFKAETEGYRLSYRLIKDNLVLGVSAIADSCNTLKITRDEWENLAVSSGVIFHNIEIQCSDKEEHRSRVEVRKRNSCNPVVPGWEKVKSRYYEPWGREVISIDTAGQTPEKSFRELREKLAL